tara:strand:- start:1065 stop:1322 length:258 start_codon:yes stop_codon:yes gene_type:complete
MYQITFKKKAAKEMLNLPSSMLPKIVNSIDNLSENPRPEGSKKLRGSDEDLWRIRIGNYRVIYSIKDSIRIVNIRKVGHRKDIYN